MTEASATLRQIWITRYGPPEVLELREAPMPGQREGEVLIKVAAAGVNFADIMARHGVYPDAPKPPCVVGYEVAGEIAGLGAGVTGLAAGQRVIAMTRFGGYSSHVCVPQGQAFPLPTGLGFLEGAALPVTYLTAYLLVIGIGRLRAGETVLVHSAGGGVGLAAIDLARIVGAEVVGVASAGKHDFLRRRGVAKLIDGRAGGLVMRVKEMTGGRGVDLVLDPIGGRSWRDSYDCLAPGGRLGAFGLAAAAGPGGRWLPMLRALAGVPWLRFNPLSLMNDNRGVFGVNLGHLWGERARLGAAMAEILQWQSQGKVAPVVDRSFGFDQAAAAHRYIEARSNTGKVLLVP
jgi:synaptic vesicle membrane protein VAT-1